EAPGGWPKATTSSSSAPRAGSNANGTCSGIAGRNGDGDAAVLCPASVSVCRGSTTVSSAPRLLAKSAWMSTRPTAIVDSRSSQSTPFGAAVLLPSRRSASAVIVHGPANSSGSYAHCTRTGVLRPNGTLVPVEPSRAVCDAGSTSCACACAKAANSSNDDKERRTMSWSPSTPRRGCLDPTLPECRSSQRLRLPPERRFDLLALLADERPMQALLRQLRESGFG